MTEVSYAEALQAEQNETEKLETVPGYLDSEQNVLAEGDRVSVSEAAEHGFHADRREFDFGRVDSLNEDGTVNVGWDSASCGCSGDDSSREEKPGDLTKTTSYGVALYYKGFYRGQDVGRKGMAEDLRELLGLDEVLAELVQNQNDN